MSHGKYTAGLWPESFFVIMGITDVEVGPSFGEQLGSLLQSEAITHPMTLQSGSQILTRRSKHMYPHKIVQ